MLEVALRHRFGPRPRQAGAEPDGFSLDIAFTEPTSGVTALFGPSGCGKTTALRILMGLDAAFEGEVRHRPARLGVVFQARTLDLELSVFQNLLYHAALHGIGRSEAKKRAEEAGNGVEIA